MSRPTSRSTRDGIEEADVFAAAQDGGQTCIEVFFFRTGQNWGNRAYFPKADRSLPVEEVLDSFIAQFYDDKPVPRLILLSHDVPNRELLAEALCTRPSARSRSECRSAAQPFCRACAPNAREALGRKLAESSSQRRCSTALQTASGSGRAAAAHRGVRQQPHPAPMPSAG